MKNTTQVLIIGGGFAGATAAYELSKAGIDVVLVDRKDYFEVTIATLRNGVDFDLMQDKPRVNYAEFIRGEFIQATVTQLSTQDAQLDNGQTIRFETAIIASGTRYPSLAMAKSHEALTLAARRQELHAQSQALSQAKSVLVMGGGAVGVELAGEIAYKYPAIQVTLAEASDSILPAYSPQTQRKVSHQLRKLGVIIETQRCYQPQGDVYKDINTGRQLCPDKAFLAAGIKPNSDFMQATLSASLTDSGFIRVDKYYKVLATDNLYAIGDIADLPDLKLAATAVPQAQRLAANVIAAQAGKKMAAHWPMPKFGMFPIGQRQGVTQLPLLTLTCKPLIDIKNNDLFVAKMFKAVGVKPR